MIYSMTAFARETAPTAQGTLTVELRSVNHRYLDCTFKLPESLRALEPLLREQASAALARGKLDCMIRLQAAPAKEGGLQINPTQLDTLRAAIDQVAGRIDTLRPPTALEVLQYPGICSAPEESEEQINETARQLFAGALTTLRDNRRREGESMASLILERLQQVEAAVASTRQLLPTLMEQQRARITTRIEELDVEVDRGRLEQELVYLAQKADVDEELDRLEAHVGEVRRALQKGGPCGRRLDFLMQELNREANTLSSKSIASGTTQNAVELKVLIEQMREQIQNIE
jgi:uncharacterized protein (TIGR00255 family)